MHIVKYHETFYNMHGGANAGQVGAIQEKIYTGWLHGDDARSGHC